MCTSRGTTGPLASHASTSIPHSHARAPPPSYEPTLSIKLSSKLPFAPLVALAHKSARSSQLAAAAAALVLVPCSYNCELAVHWHCRADARLIEAAVAGGVEVGAAPGRNSSAAPPPLPERMKEPSNSCGASGTWDDDNERD